MFLAIIALALLPFLNTSVVRNTKYRPFFGFVYWFLFVDFVLLGWIGQKPVESPYMEIGFFATYFYFLLLTFAIFGIGFIENLIYKTFYKKLGV